MSATASLESAQGARASGTGPAGSVLVVEDDSALRDALCDTLVLAGYAPVPAADGAEALATLRDSDRTRFGLVVSDVQMRPMNGLELLDSVKRARPELPVLLMTAFGTIQQAVEAMRNGACDYLVKPFEAEVLASKVSCYCQGEHRGGEPDDATLVGDAPASRELAELALRVARSDVTVMLTGESGVGKEVLARFIHRRSARAAGPFVALNCAAIPENMLEAILFGYEKGAYTGAHRASPGKFEQAQGGTLLLDEISEMALGLQAKLLRVLQEREVERLGAREPVRLDVRVVATTNRDLASEVEAGRFREDLFYRLNVFPLAIAPLRARIEDVVPLARHLLARAATEQGRAVPALSPHAQARLRAHDWPGNVRELDNVVQRALVLCADEALDGDAIRFERSGGVQPAAVPEGDTLGDELRVSEFRVIRDVLEACGGNRKAVAERLGISPRTLRYKLARMREAGIEVK